MSADRSPPSPTGASPDGSIPQLGRPRSASFGKWLIACGIVLGLIMSAVFATCIYVAVTGPDTKVLPGRQVPEKFVSQIRKLNLLENEDGGFVKRAIR